MAATGGPLVIHGANAVLEALRSGTPVERVLLGRGGRADAIAAAGRARGIAVVGADGDALTRTAGTPQHQGAVAVLPPFRYAELDRLLDPACPSALLLDGVQDPRNLGAILRTARAAGVGGVVLPQDRSAQVTPVVVAASAGLLFGLPIARVPNLVRAMEALKAAGYWLVGLAADGETDVFAFDAPSRPALVVGGEGEGLRALVRRHCDFTVAIPMAPGVESLNASVAAAIALYRVLRPPPRGPA